MRRHVRNLSVRMYRGLCALTVCAALYAVASFPVAAAEQPAPGPDAACPVPGLGKDQLPACIRPKMRFWLPLAPVDQQVLRREITDIARAGFGGVELASIPASGDDPGVNGFGASGWKQSLATIMDEAGKQGIRVDLTIGAFYPAAVPQAASAAAASRELVPARAPVSGAFDGAVPVPAKGEAGRLVALTAARIVKGDVASGPLVLDRASLVDLTGRVRDGRLRWTPPTAAGKGLWALIASWERPNGHLLPGIASSPVHAIDHFSLAGSRALIDFWNSHLAEPADLAAYRRVGGDVFEDSLHLSGYALWTPDLPEEFRRRRGYDLRPLLPAIHIPFLNEFFHGIRTGQNLTIDSPAEFELSDGSGPRLREDYYQTLTELYNERHLIPLRRYFNGLGFRYRAQPAYGQSLEGTLPATLVDVPETESFQLDGLIEGYRVQSGAVHLLGRPVYSAECCAVPGSAYAFTWRETLGHVAGLFAGGVNQIVLHGYHAQGPRSDWPGWSGFGRVFSEDYGKLPAWSQAGEASSFIARQQALLRQGRPSVDLAIYRLSYWDDGHYKLGKRDSYWSDPALWRAGFTYDFLSPSLLDLPQAGVRDGRLGPEGPGYRALVLPSAAVVPAATLARIIADAKAGLRVLVVGDPPARAPGLPVTEDAKVRRMADDLLSLPQVSRVASPDKVPEALRALGIRPAADPGAPTDIRAVRRVLPDGDVHLMTNRGAQPQRAEFRIAAGRVSEIDLWNGRSRPPREGVLSAGDGALLLPMTLSAGETRAFRTIWGPAVPDAAPADHDRVIELKDWTLTLDPVGPHPPTPVRDLPMPSASFWNRLPGLEQVAGHGRYGAGFTLPRDWRPGGAALLSVQRSGDLFQVVVNDGPAVAADPFTGTIDIGPWLRAGENRIEIRTDSTLRNLLRGLYADQQKLPAQDYGIDGAVTIRLSPGVANP